MRTVLVDIALLGLLAGAVFLVWQLRRERSVLSRRLAPDPGEAPELAGDVRRREVDAFRLAFQEAPDGSLTHLLLDAHWPWTPQRPTFVLASVVAAVAAGGIALAAQLATGRAPDASSTLVLVALAAAVAGLLPRVILLQRVRAHRRDYRRMLPDLIEMIVVCVDAGQSVPAAFRRIAREFADFHPLLGMHLEVLVLEVEAGVALHEALERFARRTELEELLALVALFRQSQTWGSDVVGTLRSFSHGLRKDRLLAAEERANALPVKIVLPTGLFIFPVLLVVLLAPLVVRILTTLSQR